MFNLFVCAFYFVCIDTRIVLMTVDRLLITFDRAITTIHLGAYSGVYLGGIPLSRAPQIFRRNTKVALTGIRPDYQFLLLIFAAIWGSDFRDNLITLTRLFKQAKQIRIPFMAMFKVNTCPPNEVH